jgi:phosphopantothenoylcysteine decarboxylase/phosphopantothenate--cysteine ligase
MIFLRGREIILGVGGGISAYKSADLVRRLQDSGFLVTVVPTRSAANFVGTATWEALSGRPAHDDLWNDISSVPHISLAKKADGIIIAPTTADLLSRIAQGRADDLLTNIVLASTAPLILVPAMHPEMWLNAATVANVATLRSRGVIVVEPDEGRMTGEDTGIGRYPDSAKIISALDQALLHQADLTGVEVLITAGGTQEAIDPVRYIGNRSSGKQGYAAAFAAASRGAKVTLISANATLPDLEGIKTVHVRSASQMHREVLAHYKSAAIVIMSAAVADATPANAAEEKIEKSNYSKIDLLPTVDILRELGADKGDRILIGFAAQAGKDARAKALTKYLEKNLDFLYFNDVSGGAIFGEEATTGEIVGMPAEGAGAVVLESVSGISKVTLANKLFDLAATKLGLSHD